MRGGLPKVVSLLQSQYRFVSATAAPWREDAPRFSPATVQGQRRRLALGTGAGISTNAFSNRHHRNLLASSHGTAGTLGTRCSLRNRVMADTKTDTPSLDPADVQRHFRAVIAQSEAQIAQAKNSIRDAEQAIRRSKELLARLQPPVVPPSPASG